MDTPVYNRNPPKTYKIQCAAETMARPPEINNTLNTMAIMMPAVQPRAWYVSSTLKNSE